MLRSLNHQIIFFSKLNEHLKTAGDRFELKYSHYNCLLKNGKAAAYEIVVDPKDSTCVRNIFDDHDGRYNVIDPENCIDSRASSKISL
jgi:hypothetical protein